VATTTLSPIHVRRDPQRCPPSLISHLAQVSTGWIVDANGKRGSLSADIRPISAATGFCGSAFTVLSRGRDNLAAYAALQYAKAGDVLVLATDAYTESSVVGDVFVGLARNLGIVAIVTDGMVRDVAGIDAVGIPVFARGLSPNSPHKDGPGELGTQVCLGGAVVHSGDVVRGDADGVVVVARTQAEAVVADLERVRAQEARMDQWVRDGLTAPPWLSETLTVDRIRYLD
jgi:4-hydroxy-4-methyl-2-oxoglutarate aldolase